MQRRFRVSRFAWVWLAVALAVPAAALAGAEGVGVVKGVVVDEGGKPVAGARVRALLLPEAGPFDPFQPALDVATDSSGRFEARLAPGRYFAVVTKGLLGLDASASRLRRWQIEAGKAPGDLRLPLKPGGRIEGTVVRKEGGREVPQAKILLDCGLTAIADRRGRFAVEGAPFGEHTLEVLAPGRANARLPLNTLGLETAGVRIAMDPGFTVQGRVSDEAGRPVAGAVVERPVAFMEVPDRVFGRLEPKPLTRLLRCGTTDAEGKYSLSGFAREGRLSYVSVSHPRFVRAYEPAEVPKAGGLVTRDVVLKEGLAVEGEVRDPGGAPVRGAEVVWSWSLPEDSVRTDEGGRFRLDGLHAPGRDSVFVLAKGYAVAAVLAKPGRGAQVPKLNVRLARGGAVEGRVVDRAGRGISGALLAVTAYLPPDG